MKKKILVIEDEQTIQGSLLELLENKGYEVETAANGVEGMFRLRAKQDFNLVLFRSEGAGYLQKPVNIEDELLRF